MNNSMDNSATTIQLQRLNQLETRFGRNVNNVDKFELAEALICSTRNVTNIMKSLSALGWITWNPGRGRGNKSSFSIVHSFEELLIARLKNMCQHGSLNQAFQYAETFHYQHTFKQHLSQWLKTNPEEIERSDELISLVNYSLPACHPIKMTDLNAGLYVNALFDTLINYHPETASFTPSLAHQFTKTAKGYAFRIRPDVYFHNGILLTPEYIKSHLLTLKSHAPLHAYLFESIKNIQVNKRWVEVELLFDDPLFLHGLSDIHSAVFLEDDKHPDFPIGTGSYCWESRNDEHWSLSKNEHYFGVNGILKRADFWSNKDISTHNMSHVIEQESTLQTIPQSPLFTHSKLAGCYALCLSHRLPLNTRKALILLVLQQANSIHPELPLCQTLFGNIAINVKNNHDNENNQVHAAKRNTPSNSETELITGTIAFWDSNSEVSTFIQESLKSLGLTLYLVSDKSKADMWISEYLFGKNTLLDHYYWLLVSETAQHLLPSLQRKQWLEWAKSTNDLNDYLSDIEEECKTNHYITPLWGKSITFKTHKSLRGEKTDSLGLMTLANLWFDKRKQ
ncbi:SgrR family transcriptional regulator [Shewanella sp. WPAGA9]|uniref:SgrR family transcriptional regulator n=1 Tax=Shewanella sp. ENK2 TaxID=2775245 RepID=UPI00177B26D9|nr:SgrR family transcriptional regulator [Shewanella sp. WPAGA9]